MNDFTYSTFQNPVTGQFDPHLANRKYERNSGPILLGQDYLTLKLAA